MQDKNLLFVYGTLKQGFGNNRYLAGSKYLGIGYTKKSYAMYSAGIPFVIKEEPISQIHGEVYQVNDATLSNLDNLEGHPDWYKREQVEINLTSDCSKSSIVRAWLYFNPEKSGTLISSGMYEQSNRF